jgi:hypothetical protein
VTLADLFMGKLRVNQGDGEGGECKRLLQRS